MSQPNLNRRLTAVDASFLYFEKKEAAMHIGSVSLFEGEIPFDQFVAMISSKMHLLPRYQQVVTPDPFGIGHPTWEFDQSFDIKRHIFRIQIDSPGRESELIELAGRIFTPMMDRRKPLWDIYLVYGLEAKRTAMIARVHHCMVDGVSGVDLLKIILDISPEVPKILSAPERPPQLPRPDATRRFFDTLLGNMQEGMNRLMEFQTGLMNLTQALTDAQTRQAKRKTSGTISQLASPVSLLQLNRPCPGSPKPVRTTFQFAEYSVIS